MKHCSPSHYKFVKHTGSCFSKDDINHIADEINKTEQKDIITNTNSVEQIEKYFYSKCKKNEYCWLDQLSYETRKKLEHAFRPLKPRRWNKNPRTWLNTDDIHYVMVQYEHLHKDFKFLGVHPIDFAERHNGYCISSNNLCDFHIDGYKQTRFAMVLNLDRHNEPGSHWVALYFNVNPNKTNYGIYYYDSTASPPDKEVTQFMEKVRQQVSLKHHKKQFKTEFNIIQRQFKNTECGMFCLVFLTQCVKNIKFAEICRRMKSDDEINKIRDILYRPNK